MNKLGHGSHLKESRRLMSIEALSILPLVAADGLVLSPKASRCHPISAGPDGQYAASGFGAVAVDGRWRMPHFGSETQIH